MPEPSPRPDAAPAGVPLAAPARLRPAEAAAVRVAIEAVLSSGRWILGDAVAEFEDAFARYVGAGSVLGVASGTDALILGLRGLDLLPGSGVLVPAHDGGFAALAAQSAGLSPVVVDVDAATGGPGVPELERALDASPLPVSALVVTHLHGRAAPIAAIDAWRRPRGLALIEDCAQAHGLRIAGRHVGTWGDAAAFSFYPTKNLGAVGDGGAVAHADAADPAVGRTARLREYGWSERFRVGVPGGLNSRLDAVQAKVLTARLAFLDARNDERRRIARRLEDACRAAGLRVEGEPASGVVHHFVVDHPRRDELAAHLAAGGVASGVHYPYPVQAMPGLRTIGAAPVAAARAGRILSLPCFPELTDAEVDAVVAALAEVPSGVAAGAAR